MKSHILLVILLCHVFLVKAQQTSDTLSPKPNPIIYLEFYFGFAGGNGFGGVVGGEVNYQNKKNLYTLKYGYEVLGELGGATVGFVGFPTYTQNLDIHEISILYGQRYVKEGHSFSFSGGLSTNYANYNLGSGDERVRELNQYFGFPFEVNIKWFKKDKKRFRAYFGMIPFGKPTSFGRSLGLKLYGNIGKFSYVGIGFNYGFGWHKKYE